jgi:hypothetical protein
VSGPGYGPSADPGYASASGSGYAPASGHGYRPSDRPTSGPGARAYADPTSAIRPGDAPSRDDEANDYSGRTVRGGSNYDPEQIDDDYEDEGDGFRPGAYQPNGERPRRGVPPDEDDLKTSPVRATRDPLLIGALVCAVLGLAPVAIGLAVVALRRYGTIKVARIMAVTAIVVSVVAAAGIGAYAMSALGSSAAPAPHVGVSVSPSGSGSGSASARPTPTLEPGCAAGESAVSGLYERLKSDPPEKIEGDFKMASAELAEAATKASNGAGADAMRTMAKDLDLLVAALEAGESTTDLVNQIDADGKKITSVCAPK